MHFEPLVRLCKRTAERAGHDGFLHSHGFIAEDTETAAEKFFSSTQYVRSKLGRERGWPPYTRNTYDAARSFEGDLYVGDPKTVAEKIIHLRKNVGIPGFMLHVPVGTMLHDEELFGREVGAGGEGGDIQVGKEAEELKLVHSSC